MLAVAPNWAEIVTAVGSALAGGTLLIGIGTAWFALRQLDESKRTRHLQWITEIGRRWDETSMEEARAAATRYDSDDLAAHIRHWLDRDQSIDVREVLLLLRVPNYFEDVALTVYAGDIDPELVARALEGPVRTEWAFWEAAIHHMRERDPSVYTQFERLAADLSRAAQATVREAWWRGGRR